MPQQITILALGSRGDVQPFVALALGLQAHNFRVVIAAAADYADLVHSYGIAFQPLVGTIRQLADQAQIEQFLDEVRNPIRTGWNFLRQVDPIIEQLMRDCWEVCRSADALIVASLGVYCGLHIIERLKIPMIVAHFHPMTPTEAAPPMFFPHWPRLLPGKRVYNRLAHVLYEHGQWQLLRRSFNRARRAVLDLPPLSAAALVQRVRHLQLPMLYGYSPSLAPPPADSPRLPITGCWPLAHPPTWQPSDDVQEFLAAGPPPILVSFGSLMLGRQVDALTQLIVRALERNGQRGILQYGWDTPSIRLPPSIRQFPALPHDWLMQHVRAVVHHGGAGVTTATLRAALPAVVVPFLGDQFFWAERLAALGVAPAPISRDTLSETLLAQALAQVLADDRMRSRADAVGSALRAEQGVERAVLLVKRYLETYAM